MNGNTPDKGPEGDLGAVLEHVGVLGTQQYPDDPPVQPEDPHQTLPLPEQPTNQLLDRWIGHIQITHGEAIQQLRHHGGELVAGHQQPHITALQLLQTPQPLQGIRVNGRLQLEPHLPLRRQLIG